MVHVTRKQLEHLASCGDCRERWGQVCEERQLCDNS
jgi:hypothetical protein